MLKIVSENLSAISYVSIDGKDERTLALNANIDKSTGTYSINKSIINVKAYLSNKDICNADYDTFEEKVLESLS